MPQSLAVRYTNDSAATQVQVYRNNNGSFVAFGTPYTPNAMSFLGAFNGKTNMAIQFGAEFYCSAGNEIRRYNSGTGNWDVVSAGPIGTNAEDVSGIYLGRGPTGTLRAVVMARGGGNGAYYRHLDTPGGAWSASIYTGLIAPAVAGGMDAGIVYNNTLFIGYRNVAFTLDFSTLASTQQTLGGSGGPHPYSFTRAKNRLFLLFSNIGNGYADIYEYIGGAFSLLLNGTTNGAMPRSQAGLPIATTPWLSMYYDEASDSLIVHSWQAGAGAGAINPGGTGWYTVQIPLTTLTEVDISTAVLPGALKAPAGPSAGGDIRFAIEVDSDTNPLVPVTYVWVLTNNGSWARYQWNGVATPMTPLGSGGNRGIGLSHNPGGGGEYFYDGSTTLLPAYHIEEVQARVPIIGGTRIFLRGYQIDETGGAPTPTDETVGLYWGTTQAQPDNLATISNPVKVSGPGTTPMVSGNKITNFTFDGTTIYSIEWAAVSDGVANQQVHALMPHVEI